MQVLHVEDLASHDDPESCGGIREDAGGKGRGQGRYGAFEVAHFSSHVLGGLFIAGVVLMVLAALHNWYRRNPF